MFHQAVQITVTVAKDYGLYTGVIIGVVFIAWRRRSTLVRLIQKDQNLRDERVCGAIKSALYSILWKLKADRAFLFEYGEYDRRLQPIPFNYADCTAEVVSPSNSIPREKDNLQRIPLHSVPFWIQELSEKGEIHIYDVEDIRQEDTSAYEILHNQQIKSCYAISIVDFCGVPLGFVGIDYCRAHMKLNKKDIEVLKCEALKIAGFLIIKRNGSLEDK